VSLKPAIKKLAARLVADDRIWSLLARSVIPFAHYAQRERRSHERAARSRVAGAAIQALVPDWVVRHGPFRGLRYPRALSNDGTLFSKLLGSYERELQPILETLCANTYADVVDIGCAEGYYAVGLALRLPSARVYAYDIDDAALSSCRTMAQLNGVGDRVVTANHVDPAVLRSLDLGERALVVCDCEGYERMLFTSEVVEHFARHDLLIELHDFIHEGLSSEIRARFDATHVITAIQSTDDMEKARTYLYDELKSYDLQTRKLLLGEVRPATMEWFYLTPRRR
jgi:predicted O-methyltransferase YrrM